MAGITITRGPAEGKRRPKGKKAVPQLAWKDVPRAMVQQGSVAKAENLQRFLARARKGAVDAG